MKISRGVALAIASATLFGVSAPFAKRLVGEMPPVLLAGLLYFGQDRDSASSGFCTAASAAHFLGARWLAGEVLFGGVVAPVLLMAALRSTPAAPASLLLNLEGVFMAVLAWFVFGEEGRHRKTDPPLTRRGIRRSDHSR